ncbi:choice-of-anchor I family protein [Guptibacillus algicola]|uniref:choice-of-anchor I family protein n=1 Tax=Guptibacillus algicola TaxID=225844 RepID=UPI001CD5D5F9|nr:choice-of-anchor I family protein [Alkalihalobacillus algicola]MCA0988476.1 choice-of-anchor I family protein [Alkalihalobacillus algicola]
MNKKPIALAAMLSMGIASFPAPSSAETGNIKTFPSDSELNVTMHGHYDSGAAIDAGGAEIIDYAKKNGMAYVVNGADQSLDILDVSANLKLYKKVSLSDLNLGSFEPGDLTSVAVHPSNEFVAVAIPNKVKTEDGLVAFFKANGDFIGKAEVGALPDMVTFTPDGKQLLVANEGEPNDEVTVDPEGSVSLIDVTHGPENPTVKTVGFNKMKDSQIDEDVRSFIPGSTPAQDFEPEYIQVTPDSKKAYVSLQENNAIAELDLSEEEFTRVHSLGFKDHSIENNGIDASNTSEEINIKPMPVLGMHQPDAIALYSVEGKNYILTPNEGDARDYAGFSEEVRVKDIVEDPDADIKLDAKNYEGFTQRELDKMVQNGLFNDDQLGRLKVTTANGKNVEGNYEALYSYGARSFSVYETDNFKQLYDSGNEFEKVTATALTDHFNASNDSNEKKDRSDDKGPEPESAEVGEINGKKYAFIGLERQGGGMVYNIDQPKKPQFVTYFTSRDFSASDGTIKGDSAPEGIKFVPAEESPTGKATLLVAHEVSGTVAAYELTDQSYDQGSKSNRLHALLDKLPVTIAEKSHSILKSLKW